MPLYKVVLNDAGTLKSAGITGTYEVTYVQDQGAVASLGKLTYFLTLEAAQDFVGGTPGSLEIWECEVFGEEVAVKLLQDFAVSNAQANTTSIQILKKFWEERIYLGFVPNSFKGILVKPINGTGLADSIRLIRKVA